MTDQKPLVSIVCEAFNHEPFIRKCLDGFVMQKTDFPFEILIHDDASTDRTADIIREYEAKYPDLFRPIYQTENQYSKRIHLWVKYQFPRARGKYIATCEGDDYWTDPLKLQKQFDYMEAHPECSLCFHNAMVHYYDGSRPDHIFAKLKDRDYTGVEACYDWIAHTASFFFRASVVEGYTKMMNQYKHILNGDIPLVVECARQGKLHALPEVMSVYGKHDSGWTHFDTAARSYLNARSWEDQRTAYGREYRPIADQIMTGYYLSSFSRGIKERKFGLAAKALWRGLILHPGPGFDGLRRLPGDRKRRKAKMKKNA